MSLGTRLELRQTTQLVMTPQLRQAISLLQYNNIELTSHLSDIVDQNPLLSVEGDTTDVGAGGESEIAVAEIPVDTAESATPEAALDAPRDAIHEEALADLKPAQSGLRGKGFSGESLSEFQHVAVESRLHSLEAQINCIKAPTQTKMIAHVLAAELDDDGYLRTPLAELSARLSIPVVDIRDGLELLQRCEPSGIGARDLGECLTLQLRELGHVDDAMLALLDNLPLVAAGDTDRLTALTGASLDQLRDMLRVIRTLDPRPSQGVHNDLAQVVVPDLIVERDGLGAWKVSLNSDTLPRVLIDNTYFARVDRDSAEVQTYIANCRSEAAWLVRSLEQRSETILKVAAEIVKQQDGFFSQGVSAIRPLTLRRVADEIQMHESTVSRVTSSKFLSCDRGMFPLKFFFSQGVASLDGREVHASESIRERIRVLIESETPDTVLSDDALVAELRKEGIKVARRTAAKYRESMNIPSSVQRRRTQGNLLRT